MMHATRINQDGVIPRSMPSCVLRFPSHGLPLGFAPSVFSNTSDTVRRQRCIVAGVACVGILRSGKVSSRADGCTSYMGAKGEEDFVPLDLEAEGIDGLPSFCGAVVSPQAEVLIIGVSHSDDGESGRAARRLIELFDPDVCLLELDRQRFSRLVAARRGLPWAYAPQRGAAFLPEPGTAAAREAVFMGLGAASRAAGVPEGSGEEDGGGDEFFAAFEAAETLGAFVVLGDLPVSRTLDGAVAAFRRGLGDPVGQLVAGSSTLLRAVGGLVGRPVLPSGRVSWARGVAVPQALAADGGKRAGPLLRSVCVGGAVAAGLRFLINFFGSGPITAGGLEHDRGRIEAIGALNIVILALGLALIAMSLSAFALAFLRERDTEMVATLASAIKIVGQRQASEAGGCEVASALSNTFDQHIWCKWRKKSSATDSPSFRESNGVLVELPRSPPRNRKRAMRPLHVPVRAMPFSLPVATSEAESGTRTAWLPIFTAKRPLAEGELRRLSLFEPRFLRLVDALIKAGGRAPDLVLGVVHARHGSERPQQFLGANAPGSASVTFEPVLEVEVDALLEGQARVARIERMWEAVGEDGQRRWRLEVRGVGQRVSLHACDLSCDDLGALWVSPAAPATVFKASSAGHDKVSDDSAHSDDVKNEQHQPRAVRGVAVVGLLHVNGVARALQRELAQEAPAAVPATALPSP